MNRLYRYVGPKHTVARLQMAAPGSLISTVSDVIKWIRTTGQALTRSGEVVATFVVDENGALRIADRRSEHVACAGGHPVMSAGEITFCVVGVSVEISHVTNQSSGYCPEPRSWDAVEKVLHQIGLRTPASFSTAFEFRHCEKCRTINIIKDAFFECIVCSHPLPLEWNFSDTA